MLAEDSSKAGSKSALVSLHTCWNKTSMSCRAAELCQDAEHCGLLLLLSWEQGSPSQGFQSLSRDPPWHRPAHEGQGTATLTTMTRLNSRASVFSSLASCIMTAKPGGGQSIWVFGDQPLKCSLEAGDI